VQLALQLLDGRGTRTRAVREIRGAGQPKLAGELRERGRKLLGRLRPVPHELIAMTSELARPAAERGGRGCAGASTGEEGIPLTERARMRTRRAPRRGPERAHDLSEMGGAHARRSLHELEPVGGEDADERARRRGGRAIEASAVGADNLRPG